MKSIILLIAGLFLFSFGMTATTTTQRKKVGLVLSGGGAKGMAHIGALKVIEKQESPLIM